MEIKFLFQFFFWIPIHLLLYIRALFNFTISSFSTIIIEKHFPQRFRNLYFFTSLHFLASFYILERWDQLHYLRFFLILDQFILAILFRFFCDCWFGCCADTLFCVLVSLIKEYGCLSNFLLIWDFFQFVADLIFSTSFFKALCRSHVHIFFCIDLGCLLFRKNWFAYYDIWHL